MSRIVNLGLIQKSCREDVESNFDKAAGYFCEASEKGCISSVAIERLLTPTCDGSLAV